MKKYCHALCLSAPVLVSDIQSIFCEAPYPVEVQEILPTCFVLATDMSYPNVIDIYEAYCKELSRRQHSFPESALIETSSEGDCISVFRF